MNRPAMVSPALCWPRPPSLAQASGTSQGVYSASKASATDLSTQDLGPVQQTFELATGIVVIPGEDDRLAGRCPTSEQRHDPADRRSAGLIAEAVLYVDREENGDLQIHSIRLPPVANGP